MRSDIIQTRDHLSPWEPTRQVHKEEGRVKHADEEAASPHHKVEEKVE